MEIADIIKKLDLKHHPEGGYFKETYRSSVEIPSRNLPQDYTTSRNFSTCIYFLLTSEEFSAFHKIKQDESGIFTKVLQHASTLFRQMVNIWSIL